MSLIAERPEIEAVDVNSSAWESKGDVILDFAVQGVMLQDQKIELTNNFTDNALDYDWMPIRGPFLSLGSQNGDDSYLVITEEQKVPTQQCAKMA